MQDSAAETPLWMKGNYEPVREETTAFELPVKGAIPPELRGLYARNGANPRGGRYRSLVSRRRHGSRRLDQGRQSGVVSEPMGADALFFSVRG